MDAAERDAVSVTEQYGSPSILQNLERIELGNLIEGILENLQGTHGQFDNAQGTIHR